MSACVCGNCGEGARDCHANCSGILTRHHRHLEERSQRVQLVIVTGTAVTRFCFGGWFSGYYGLDFTSIVANGSVGYCYWYCGDSLLFWRLAFLATTVSTLLPLLPPVQLAIVTGTVVT